MGEHGSDLELFPQVKWAQRKSLIILRVFIKPVEKPDFTIRRDYMTFKGKAIGMSGKAIYRFELPFYEPVQSDKCRVKFFEGEIEFRLLKEQDRVWPRLQTSVEKPHWISVDFTRWEYQKESDDEEEEVGEGQNLDPEKKARVEKTKEQLAELEERMKKDLEKYDKLVRVLDKVKLGYLVVYNGIQWSGFILIVLALLKSLRGGSEGISGVYEKTISMLMFCQAFMLLEIVHSMLGIVKTGVIPSCLQVLGRFAVIYVVILPAEEIHQHPIMFCLFLVWSLIELIRYPFYALSLLNFEVSWLTWLRYSAWIPLFPLGFTCEALTIWLSLSHFDNSKDFQYSLPNKLNISFYPSYALRAAIFCVPLIAYSQLSYMAVQRKRKLAKLKTQ